MNLSITSGGPPEKQRPRAEQLQPEAADESKQANHSGEWSDGATGEARLLHILQTRLSRYGFHVASLIGSDLLISHREYGVSRTVPDLRGVRAFLRHVEGAR